MTIQLDTPVTDPGTGESLTHAGVRKIMLDPLGDPPLASYLPVFGVIEDGRFVSKLDDPLGRKTVRDVPTKRAS